MHLRRRFSTVIPRRRARLGVTSRPSHRLRRTTSRSAIPLFPCTPASATRYSHYCNTSNLASSARPRPTPSASRRALRRFPTQIIPPVRHSSSHCCSDSRHFSSFGSSFYWSRLHGLVQIKIRRLICVCTKLICSCLYMLYVMIEKYDQAAGAMRAHALLRSHARDQILTTLYHQL